MGRMGRFFFFFVWKKLAGGWRRSRQCSVQFRVVLQFDVGALLAAPSTFYTLIHTGRMPVLRTT
jgi:hypothetical protein